MLAPERWDLEGLLQAQQHLDGIICSLLDPKQLSDLAACSRVWHARTRDRFELLIRQLGATSSAPNGRQYSDLTRFGRFDLSAFCANRPHRGVLVSQDGRSLLKTDRYPDSNNVFLGRGVRDQPAWVKFLVHRSTDELIFGVTHEPEKVAALSGFSNCRLSCTVAFSKQTHATPRLKFGSIEDRAEAGCPSIRAGDEVGIRVDPLLRQVQFWHNSEAVLNPASSGVELVEAGEYGVYVLVDDTGDSIQIVDFGYGDFVLGGERSAPASTTPAGRPRVIQF